MVEAFTFVHEAKYDYTSPIRHIHILCINSSHLIAKHINYYHTFLEHEAVDLPLVLALSSLQLLRIVLLMPLFLPVIVLVSILTTNFAIIVGVVVLSGYLELLQRPICADPLTEDHLHRFIYRDLSAETSPQQAIR